LTNPAFSSVKLFISHQPTPQTSSRTPRKKKRSTGPPIRGFKRTEKAFQDILADIANGISVAKVCRARHLSERTFYHWIFSDPTLEQRYARAKGNMAEKMANELAKLSDEARGLTNEGVQAVRLQVDTRKWIISKLLPSKYGDRPTEVNTAVHVHNHTTAEQQKEWQRRRMEALERAQNSRNGISPNPGTDTRLESGQPNEST
jgi:hypothetical protein